MRGLRTACILVLCNLPLPALAIECAERTEGSPEWASCLAERVFASDERALNATYKRTLSALNKPEWSKDRASLVASQNAWLEFRDRECKFAQRLAGADILRTAWTQCRADLTKDRTRFLERVLEYARRSVARAR